MRISDRDGITRTCAQDPWGNRKAILVRILSKQIVYSQGDIFHICLKRRFYVDQKEFLLDHEVTCEQNFTATRSHTRLLLLQ